MENYIETHDHLEITIAHWHFLFIYFYFNIHLIYLLFCEKLSWNYRLVYRVCAPFPLHEETCLFLCSSSWVLWAAHTGAGLWREFYKWQKQSGGGEGVSLILKSLQNESLPEYLHLNHRGILYMCHAAFTATAQNFNRINLLTSKKGKAHLSRFLVQYYPWLGKSIIVLSYYDWQHSLRPSCR